jgi:hypothetical protein
MPRVAPPGRADTQMRPCGRIDAGKTSLGIFMAMGDIASSKQSHDKPPASGHGTREGFYPLPAEKADSNTAILSAFVFDSGGCELPGFRC